MKTGYWVLLIIIIVAINNVLMLIWIERKQGKSSYVEVAEPKVKIGQTISAQTEASTKSVGISAEPSAYSVQISTPQAEGEDSNFINTLKRVSRTREFIGVLDGYQMEVQRRYQEIGKKQRGMSARELYDVILGSDDLFEKQSAMAQLSQGKLSGFEPYELKELYQDDTLGPWVKTGIIAALLDKGDSEALVWAKEAMLEGTTGAYIDDKLIRGIYEQDKAFIIDYLDNLSLDNGQQLSSFLSLFSDEPELASGYYSRNFDKILESQGDFNFQYISYRTKIDLTDAQQVKLLEFFGNRSREKRNFAIGLINSIDDIDVLRDGYSRLERKSDKHSFMVGLFQERRQPEKAELMRELAVASDDPEIQKYANTSR